MKLFNAHLLSPFALLSTQYSPKLNVFSQAPNLHSFLRRKYGVPANNNCFERKFRFAKSKTIDTSWKYRVFREEKQTKIDRSRVYLFTLHFDQEQTTNKTKAEKKTLEIWIGQWKPSIIENYTDFEHSNEKHLNFRWNTIEWLDMCWELRLPASAHRQPVRTRYNSNENDNIVRLFISFYTNARCSGVWRRAVQCTLADDDWRQISGGTLRFANVCTNRCWGGKIRR